MRLIAVVPGPTRPEAGFGELHFDKGGPVPIEIDTDIDACAVRLAPCSFGQRIALGWVLKNNSLDRWEHFRPRRLRPISSELEWPEQVERERLRALEMVNPKVQVLPTRRQPMIPKRKPQVLLPVLARCQDVACLPDGQLLACSEFPERRSDVPLPSSRRLRQRNGVGVAEPFLANVGDQALIRLLAVLSPRWFDSVVVGKES
jgi:hypothetical protein